MINNINPTTLRKMTRMRGLVILPISPHRGSGTEINEGPFMDSSMDILTDNSKYGEFVKYVVFMYY